jgi:hypothetical protein
MVTFGKRPLVIIRILAVILVIFAGSSTPAQTAPNVTMECGTLATSTTWTLNNSPYSVCNTFGFTIPQNLTLTIDPGVIVQFADGASAKLYVAGNLSASGTLTQTVTFTRGITSTATWGGIYADGSPASPANVNLDNVNINYGGVSGTYGAGVYADRAAITITHSIIQNGGGSGVYATNNTHFNLQSINFVGNGQDAVNLNTPSTDPLMSNLSASGNGNNAVHIGGISTTWHGQRRWANPGIPYTIDGTMSNQAGDVLTIDPGNTLQFGSSGSLSIGGRLNALGTASEPITMTSQTKTVGGWRGLVVYGGSIPAVAQLDYVTIEDAGNDIQGANIEVSNANLIVHHSIIRNSQKDGVRFDTNAEGAILQSQFVGNTLYGLRNGFPTRAVLAGEDYWGAADGPTSDLAGTCTSGSGQKVTAGVLFSPFLTSADQQVSLPLVNAPLLTITPEAWYQAADGTPLYFDITLVDGNGDPLPGRQVSIATTLGTATSGGITDAFGKTRAYVTSTTPGDATVTAQLNGLTSCEDVLSPQTKVTFTTPITGVDLFAGSKAPYEKDGISVSPLPVVTGVNTTITAHLTNPTAKDVTVNVSFGFAQAGIGLAFGPIKTYTGQVVPANGALFLTASFVPSVSGHYCVVVNYTITAIGALLVQQEGNSSNPLNLNVYQSTSSNNDKPNGLDKTNNSLKAVNRFVNNAYRPNPAAVPLAVANAGIAMDLKWASQIDQAEKGDPPRQDYTHISTPDVINLAQTQVGSGVTQAHADALNALQTAVEQANAYGHAATIALDRYGGASEAGDLTWASTQQGVMQEYNQLYGAALVTAAQKMDDLVAELATEGITSVIITPAQAAAMQADLNTNGFTTQAIADAHALGMTDADLAAFKADILAASPEDLAGDLIVNMEQIAADYRSLGNILQHPDTFNPGFTVGGSGGAPVSANAVNSMAQVYNTTATVQIGNPLAQSATIALSVRPVSLPAGWTADVSPAQVTLDPGTQTPVTVTLSAAEPVPQGSTPEVAVEGYANGQLLGGVTIKIVVPYYMPFDGKLRTYLPVINR